MPSETNQKRQVSGLVSAACALLLTTGCSTPKTKGGTAEAGDHISAAADQGSFRVDLTWQTPLAALTNLTATLSFQNSAGAPQPVSDVSLKPWMPGMGHGTYMGQLKITPGESAAVYTVDHLYFSMGGNWDVQVEAKLLGSGNPADTAHIAVKVP